MEYCFGGAATPFGALRIADGHPAPYRPSVIEIGNEQYNNNFVAQVEAMEAKVRGGRVWGAQKGFHRDPPTCFPTIPVLRAANT